MPLPFGVQLREGEDTILQPDFVIYGTDKITPRDCIGAPDQIIDLKIFQALIMISDIYNSYTPAANGFHMAAVILSLLHDIRTFK